MRWDTPSTNDSALLEIFIQLSNAINVFVGTKPKDPNYQYVPAFTSRDPTLMDVAGDNSRDPQKSILTVLLRGGTQSRFYNFVIIQTIQVTMKIQMSKSQFFGVTFIANLALLLGIDSSRIKIASVGSGSQGNTGIRRTLETRTELETGKEKRKETGIETNRTDLDSIDSFQHSLWSSHPIPSFQGTYTVHTSDGMKTFEMNLPPPNIHPYYSHSSSTISKPSNYATRSQFSIDEDEEEESSSTVVAFDVYPSDKATSNSSAAVAQVNELQDVLGNITSSISSGKFSEAIGAPLLQVKMCCLFVFWPYYKMSFFL